VFTLMCSHCCLHTGATWSGERLYQQLDCRSKPQQVGSVTCLAAVLTGLLHFSLSLHKVKLLLCLKTAVLQDRTGQYCSAVLQGCCAVRQDCSAVLSLQAMLCSRAVLLLLQGRSMTETHAHIVSPPCDPDIKAECGLSAQTL
jgi:hypothetical protein